ncbi:MAG TPA: hypothetical protein VIC08_00925 [Cellvibrionaceae bacterium]
MRFFQSLLYILIGVALTVFMTACERESVSESSTPPPINPVPPTTSDLTLCQANPSWVSNPRPPDEIPDNGESFCDFYQFSWQWFLYLMSPSAENPEQRNFQLASDYPVLQVDRNSCNSPGNKPTFFVRTVKADDENSEFVLPERISQAGGGATIYDQHSNVVFYSVSFGRSLCDAPSSGNLPADTTELKLAWKVIEPDDKADYLWMEADVIPSEEGQAPVNETLGLIGFHLVRATVEHPEMVWASFEHKSNAANCIAPESAPANSWSFLSSSCQECLNNPSNQCLQSCSFNQAKAHQALTGTPTEICRVFPEGTAPNDHKAQENIADVMALNNQLIGPDGILTQLSDDNPMAVVSNYFNIGALWVSDPGKPAATDNQRGSLQLANPVMETTFQGSLQLNNDTLEPSTQGAVNCFGCHQYTPDETATSGLSHIISTIREQQD